MKLSAHRAGPFDRSHGSEFVEELPEEEISFILCSANPVYKAGFAEHVSAAEGVIVDRKLWIFSARDLGRASFVKRGGNGDEDQRAVYRRVAKDAP